jgi:hypothetical protein
MRPERELGVGPNARNRVDTEQPVDGADVGVAAYWVPGESPLSSYVNGDPLGDLGLGGSTLVGVAEGATVATS